MQCVRGSTTMGLQDEGKTEFCCLNRRWLLDIKHNIPKHKDVCMGACSQCSNTAEMQTRKTTKTRVDNDSTRESGRMAYPAPTVQLRLLLHAHRPEGLWKRKLKAVEFEGERGRHCQNDQSLRAFNWLIDLTAVDVCDLLPLRKGKGASPGTFSSTRSLLLSATQMEGTQPTTVGTIVNFRKGRSFLTEHHLVFSGPCMASQQHPIFVKGPGKRCVIGNIPRGIQYGHVW